MLGAILGRELGMKLGLLLGRELGLWLGASLGWKLGLELGVPLGDTDGFELKDNGVGGCVGQQEKKNLMSLENVANVHKLQHKADASFQIMDT